MILGRGDVRKFDRSDIVGTIRNAVTGQSIWLTSHSKMRIDERGIDDDLIFETVNHPDSIEPHPDYSNASNRTKRFPAGVVRIGIVDDSEPFILITAFFMREEHA